MNKELKAYVVHEDCEGNCAIVFATNGATARRDGGNKLDLQFDEVESCRREPAFDQYAPGPVPLHATLAAGWWHECQHCEVRFTEEGRDDQDEADREDAFEPAQDTSRSTYCCPACMMQRWAERRERTARQVAAIEATLIRWPLATGVTAQEYSRGHPHRDTEMRAQFTLPSIRYPVNWVPGESTVSVSQCDIVDFTRLYGARPGQEGGAP